jgi:PhnB protein
MNRVSTYLNFQGDTEAAFNYYATVFGTEVGNIVRIGDMMGEGGPELTDAEKKMVGHVEMPIHAGHVLMATDMIESMDQHRVIGNNTTINLEIDTKFEAERIYAALADGGSESTGLNPMPWAIWGCTLDQFGIRWMFNCYEGYPQQ